MAMYAEDLASHNTILYKANQADTIARYLFAVAPLSFPWGLVDLQLDMFGKQAHYIQKHYENANNGKKSPTELNH
eukprot:8173673-Ditylum_brightwellii.AAC.1